MSMKKYTASTYEKAADETLRSAYRMCEQRIAEAVAAEREACCAAMCGLCAGINPDYGPAVYEAPPLGTMPPFWQHPHISTGNPWEAVPCHAADIRARTGEGEQG